MSKTTHLPSFYVFVGILVAATAANSLYLHVNPPLQDSLNRVKLLNQQFDVAAEFITPGETSTQDALFADVLGTDDAERPTYKGLIATLHQPSDKDAILILEPHAPMPDDVLQSIADKYKAIVPELESVELDQNIDLESTDTSDEVSEDLSKVGDADQGKKSIRVAVLDSGIDVNHDVFKNITLLDGWNTVGDNEDVSDDVGHGTHVAGIIAMNSSNIELIPYKVVSKSAGRLSNVLKALKKVLNDDVDVVNMSFGFSKGSVALESILQELNDEGVTFIAAAGNKNESAPFYPADYDNVIAVAATDMYGNKLPKSNFGDWVDVAAYGYNILSAVPDQKYKKMTGTSQATALVTAKFIDYLQSNAVDSDTFEEKLENFTKLYSTPIAKGYLKGKAFISSN